MVRGLRCHRSMSTFQTETSTPSPLLSTPPPRSAVSRQREELRSQGCSGAKSTGSDNFDRNFTKKCTWALTLAPSLVPAPVRGVCDGVRSRFRGFLHSCLGCLEVIPIGSPFPSASFVETPLAVCSLIQSPLWRPSRPLSVLLCMEECR